MFATNVVGTMLCAREAVRRMSRRTGGEGGAIVNVSSGAARYGSPGEYVDYAATRGRGGDVYGGSGARGRGGRDPGKRREAGIHLHGVARGGRRPRPGGSVKSLVPMQRGGEPEEVATAILWLLSDEASYVTGTFIDVAGGR